MNISYHYFTVKVLAVRAGFREEEAQIIAYYSQMVDDFVLSHRIIVGEMPPDFFVENGLAWELGNGSWGILPCPTGINFIKSVSHGYQRHTLAPFHFIPPCQLEAMESRPDFTRLDYRCVCAGEREDLLIHDIVGEAARSAKNERTVKNLMRLGMTLHTYADTYAHCHFSGFHGCENEALISKAYNKRTGAEAVPDIERTLLRELPSIGHANVGTVPDICSYDIAYRIKASESGGLENTVERDNTASFSLCSRRILDLLCEMNGNPRYPDEEWEKLRTALVRAQYVKKDTPELLEKSFGQAFPDIVFTYDKNSRLSIKLRVEGNPGLCGGEECAGLCDGEGSWQPEEWQNMDTGMAGFGAEVLRQEISRETLEDAFSLPGNSRRSAYRTFLEEPGQEFFQYIELAYERVMQVTGQYVSEGTRDNFREICCQDVRVLQGMHDA